MADDFDDLLEEIEESLTRESRAKATQPPQKETKTIEDEELDRIISEICDDDDDPVPTKPGHTQWKKTSSPSTTKSNNRCTMLLLGGSLIAMGLCERNHQRSCDKLRCTSCDFPVMWFNDHVWHSKCDYLFFRNNVPNADKLKKNLVRKRGSRAYACQCSWESVDRTVEVSTLSKLKWVCGKH